MTREPTWLTKSQVLVLQHESLQAFGGLPGVRDEHLLESALARPRHRFAYAPDVTLHHLAAAYAFGIARNHPFVDGNKRAALLSIRAFLFLNGTRFEPSQAETVAFIEGLASGEVEEAQLAHWIASNSTLR